MDKKDLRKKVIEIVAKTIHYPELKDNPNVDLIENDLVDSLAFIELIEAFENEFNIEIYPSQVSSSTWRSVDNLTSMIEEMINKQ